MNVEVVAAFFADAANQGDDARFAVIGGGLHSIETERLPLALDIEAVVVGLRALGDELGEGVLEMRLIDPFGKEMSRVSGELQLHHPDAFAVDRLIAGGGAVLPDRILWVVLPLSETVLTAPGAYRCEFRLEGVLSPYTLPLTVALLGPEPPLLSLN
jgi:hypothetical protein